MVDVDKVDPFWRGFGSAALLIFGMAIAAFVTFEGYLRRPQPAPSPALMGDIGAFELGYSVGIASGKRACALQGPTVPAPKPARRGAGA